MGEDEAKLTRAYIREEEKILFLASIVDGEDHT